MSEKINNNAEYKPEALEKDKRVEALPPQNELRKSSHEHQNKINEIRASRASIEKFARSSKEISQDKIDKTPDEMTSRTVQIGSQLHSQTLEHNLKKIQTKLPTYQRQFSRFIHNSKVEKLSDATGSTIARPSGLLFAGIFSFVASLMVLSMCRYFGYEYNYFIGLVSLAGGFMVGLLLEAAMKLVKARY